MSDDRVRIVSGLFQDKILSRHAAELTVARLGPVLWHGRLEGVLTLNDLQAAINSKMTTLSDDFKHSRKWDRCHEDVLNCIQDALSLLFIDDDLTLESVARRAGFLFHHELAARETGDIGDAFRSRALEIVNLWIPEKDRAEALWVSHRLSHAEDNKKNSVKTRLAATDSGKGMMGYLRAGLFKDLNHTGFRVHPQCFVLSRNGDFIKALDDASSYLSSLKIWPSGVVIEWDIEISRDHFGSAPLNITTLQGGSAGAALGLTAGALLAREYLKEKSAA